MATKASRLVREALLVGSNTAKDVAKQKGPIVPDGLLSIDSRSDLEDWCSSLDVAECNSTYLDDDDDGGSPGQGWLAFGLRNLS